ncbi:fumarylacetoacetase [Asticcacaulis sp. AC466]|uniref:fumarylacetoacetase n=1 Tax=Asticcacaulis sp. AC466 TaxID=1282362 RepID=UPI0012DF3BF9|nr:fumarylacetoacetase [Asticcacaulis sp. AC466]
MTAIDNTHDPKQTSWVSSANGHADFPIQNLPYGLVSPPNEAPRAAVAIGESIIDLQALVAAGLMHDPITLDAILATPALRKSVRTQMSRLLSDERYIDTAQPYLHAASDCTVHLPTRIGDYTDFYAGIHHAVSVGKLFRPDNPLLPNYKHVPIGYHGRASSIRPSGEPVVRPKGQTRAPDAESPVFGPSKRLDFELELGVWVGPGNALGTPIDIADAATHIAGFCLLNDWSARDFQAWEYQPLGPFLAKNFMTTISPWIVTPEALAPFRLAQPARPDGDPRPLPYLWGDADQASGALNLKLEVTLRTQEMRAQNLPAYALSHSEARHMYWTVAQLLTHHASNGCNLQPGDLLGTGTISGPTPDSAGSLLEISEGGKKPVTLPSNETRTFLEDGDELILRANAEADGFASLGFGDCRGVILPAR